MRYEPLLDRVPFIGRETKVLLRKRFERQFTMRVVDEGLNHGVFHLGPWHFKTPLFLED